MSRLIRSRLADDAGFTMVIVLGVLVVVMGFTAATFAVADNDVHVSGRNADSKAAYAAAEAGANAYLAQLNGNPSFWAECADPPGVTDAGTAAEWQPVATGSTAMYTAELLPANGTCSKASPDTTMLSTDGLLRVRVTGKSGASAARRSIVVTMRRAGFLDFLLWTDYESMDPRVTTGVWSCDPLRVWRTTAASAGEPFGQGACYTTRGASGAATPTMGNWTDGNCNTYWRDGRNAGATFPGEIYAWDTAAPKGMKWMGYTAWFLGVKKTLLGAASTYSGLTCEEASFGPGDSVAGPLHTNDSLRICGGGLSFGRDAADRIEVVAGDAQQPWRADPGSSCGGAAQPTPGQWITGSHGATKMDPPPQSQLTALKDTAAYAYTGGTSITFGQPTDSQMTVVNNGTTTVENQPANGVIFVGNKATCTATYNPMFPFRTTGAASDACGDAAISGTYNQNMTVVSENDVLITDDVVRNDESSAMLGLIGGQFVRIDHPSTLATGLGALMPWPSCTNTSSATDDLTLDAAILALNGSFLVDRFGCGASMGTLNLTGAVAQKHRGLVGVSNGANSTGYVKNYVYDTRLRYRTPPNFLDPVNSAWTVVRQIEQTPAAY